MSPNQIIHFILDQLSVGNFLQNLGFYTLLILLGWLVSVQFKQKTGRYKIN